MSSIYTLGFWKDAAERAAATAVQTVVGLLTINNVLNFASLDFKAIAGAVLVAALSSLGKSLVAALLGTKGSASLTNSVEPVKSPADRAIELTPEIESIVKAQIDSVQERLIVVQKQAEQAGSDVVSTAGGVVAQVQEQVKSISDVVREQLSRLGR